MPRLNLKAYPDEKQLISEACQLSASEVIYLLYILDTPENPSQVLSQTDILKAIRQAFSVYMHTYIEHTDSLKPDMQARAYVLYQVLSAMSLQSKFSVLFENIPQWHERLMEASKTKTGVMYCADFDAHNFHAVSEAMLEAYMTEHDMSLQF